MHVFYYPTFLFVFVDKFSFVKQYVLCTVTTFNCCTKSPDRIHDRTPDYHPVFREWMHV